MSKEFSQTLDQQMKAGVLEDELDAIHKRHHRRNEQGQENRSLIKRRIRRSIAIAAGIGVSMFVGNEILRNHDNQQKATNDIPGQQYLKQGLENGSIDPSQAVHLNKEDSLDN